MVLPCDRLRWALGAIFGTAALTGAALLSLTALETRRVQRLIPRDGEFFEVDGSRLHYVDRGEGPPIVMIHGLGGQLRNFNYLLDELTERHRVILVDRPGSGYSNCPRGAGLEGIARQASLVCKLIEHLKIERPLLVGHSLGGAIALAVGLNHPEQISGLALLAPVTQMLTDLPAAFRGLAVEPAPLRVALAWTLVAPLSRWGPRAVVEELFSPDPVPSDFEVRAGSGLARRPNNFQASAWEMRALPNELPQMVERYASLSVPVRILFGEGDTILDPRVHGEALLKAAPDARLKIIPGGHMLPVAWPSETAAWIHGVAEEIRHTSLSVVARSEDRARPRDDDQDDGKPLGRG